ncbi:amino acid permease-domain-containing protein [Pterulicium gracile]|uniref:Amino acid permease-domain-containing protein n=1 Tax=Pterulicium gracile TaxID=1884261 RepID=A0A5C3QVP8_9AGAR|nr:amino acid permease-domain-containing protein [Pterula gracilis]
MLQQQVRRRHLNMIAVGGSIGTGLFVGSGSALSTGGPAVILTVWLIIGILMINVTQAISDLSILYPVSAVAVVPLEITAAGFTVNYWANDVPIAGWITIFWVVLIIMCLFGTLGYAEEEFWSSCLKLFVVVLFILMGIVCICGGGPASGQYSSYVGGRFWSDPGAFANGFEGVCSVFVTAGTEIVGLAASETPNPRATMPGLSRAPEWTLIYIASLTMIGLLMPYNEPRLLGGGGANVSPFGTDTSPDEDLINVTICVSVISVELSLIYAGSRVLTALAETGYAPRVFTYVDKAGRPLFSVGLLLLVAVISYANVAEDGDVVFSWLVSISGLSTLFTWGSILPVPLLIQNRSIRFRRAWKVQGHSLEELPYQAIGGVHGSWFGFVMIILVLIAQLYVVRCSYMAFFIIVGFWIAGYARKRGRPLRAHEIDLDTGRKSWLTVEDMRQYKAERAAAPLYKRVCRLLFSH